MATEIRLSQQHSCSFDHLVCTQSDNFLAIRLQRPRSRATDKPDEVPSPHVSPQAQERASYRLRPLLEGARTGVVQLHRKARSMSASLIGRLGSSTFGLSTTAMSMSPTGSRFSPESALGPSIMGSEDEAEQSLGRPSRQATAGPSGHANSPHPSSREGHLSTAQWNSSVLLSKLILHGCHAAAAARCRPPRCGA